MDEHIQHSGSYKANRKFKGIYEQFCIRQDADYISEFDRNMAKYLKGDKKDDDT